MKLWTIGLCAMGVLFLAAAANAAPAFSAERTTIGVRLQYGAVPNNPHFNPYKVGIALGGGYTLKNGLYLGGNLDYFVGSSERLYGPAISGYSAENGSSSENKVNVWQVMATGGYDLRLAKPVVLRPYASLGLASGHRKFCNTDLGITACARDSEQRFAAAVGVTPIVALGKAFILADGRFNLVFADVLAKSLMFGLGGGIHF